MTDQRIEFTSDENDGQWLTAHRIGDAVQVSAGGGQDLPARVTLSRQSLAELARWAATHGGPVYLTAEEIAIRWGGVVSVHTINSWRAKDTGPRWMRLGRQVVYRLEDVEAYEMEGEK